MICEFSVRNFRSVKSLQTVSLEAMPIKSRDEQTDHNSVAEVTRGLSLLRSCGIYGANGSGKSNLIKALQAMQRFVAESMKDEYALRKAYNPFVLDQSSESEPVFFQVVFWVEGVRYRYGFELMSDRVKSEWLFAVLVKKEVMLFTRFDAAFTLSHKWFPEGKGLEAKTSLTNLFVNVAGSYNGLHARRVRNFFLRDLLVSGGDSDSVLRGFTVDYLQDEESRRKIVDFLNLADFGFKDIRLKQTRLVDDAGRSLGSLVQEGRFVDPLLVITERDVFDEQGNRVASRSMLMDENESAGTVKMFNYSGAVLNALERGSVVVLDEFDSKMHPMLTLRMIEMFNSCEINKRGAQLVFVTHDTNLLNGSLLRRDQIYFAEKNSRNETYFYSLADFKGVRNDASYGKDYIRGKYGAVPFLGDFSALFDSDFSKEQGSVS